MLHETPSVLLARMVRQQNDPKLFMAGSTAPSTRPRERRITICPSIPAISQQGGRHPVFTASKTWDIPSVVIMG